MYLLIGVVRTVGDVKEDKVAVVIAMSSNKVIVGKLGGSGHLPAYCCLLLLMLYESGFSYCQCLPQRLHPLQNIHMIMKTIVASRTPHESSFSFSRRHFQHIIDKVLSKHDDAGIDHQELKQLNSHREEENLDRDRKTLTKKKKKNIGTSFVSRFGSAVAAAIVGRSRPTRVCGTLFGRRRGHVHLAFQPDPKSAPALLIELAMPTADLVREMASGLVRIALECDREGVQWRAYCNGRKCRFAVRRECGEEERRVLRAVEPVTMGAGVLPPPAGACGDHGVLGEMMYMRARFERVVGSRDSEAFYMMNPDGNSGPELSLYLLRV